MESIAGPSQKNTAISYTTSRKGSPIIMYENRLYRKFKKYKNGSVLWRCTVKSCTGFLTINCNEEILKWTKHTCDPKNSAELQRKATTVDLQRMTASTNEPISKIYRNKSNTVRDQGLNLDLPSFRNIKSALYNKRKMAQGVVQLFVKSPMDVQKYTSQNNKKRKLAAENQLKEDVKIELQQENSNYESTKSESSNDSDHESNGSADHESVISDPLDEPNIVYKNVSGSRPKTGMFQNLTEYDAVGINVGKKLSKMDPTQALYAESIINHVLRKGLLNKLKDVTDLCDGGCGSQQW